MAGRGEDVGRTGGPPCLTPGPSRNSRTASGSGSARSSRPRPQPKGGRPFADDRACFEGIVYVLRNGVRWRDLPACYPSGVTCWRRQVVVQFGVFRPISACNCKVPGSKPYHYPAAPGVDGGRGLAPAWKLVLAELAAAGRLETSELVLDGTFIEAKKGAPASDLAGGARGRRSNSPSTRGGVSLGAATDGANVHEVNLAGPARADVPPGVSVPWAVPVLADRGYDSDPLRDDLAVGGFELLARHRKNRVKPPTADGRKLRRLSRRWVVERTFAWVKEFRRVATRYEVKCHLYDGFVALACAFIALARL